MPIALRSDFDASTLRRLARRTRDSAQARRLIALAIIYDGGSGAQAAETGGVIPGSIDDNPFDVIAGLDPAIHSTGISIGYADGMDARLGGRA